MTIPEQGQLVKVRNKYFLVHTEPPDAYKKITENLTLVEEGKKYQI